MEKINTTSSCPLTKRSILNALKMVLISSKMLPCISAQALYGKLPEKHHISVVCSTILRKQSAYNTWASTLPYSEFTKKCHLSSTGSFQSALSFDSLLWLFITFLPTLHTSSKSLQLSICIIYIIYIIQTHN